jgi:hypothetical protein
MVETFELAEPGKAFEVYSECRLRRVKQAQRQRTDYPLLSGKS